MNSKKPYSAFPEYVKEMEKAFVHWATASVPETISELEPAFDFDYQSELKKCLDFKTLLSSGNFCGNVFAKTFSLLTTEMEVVFRRQLHEFLGDGIFAGDIPKNIKEILDKCPLTNLTGERLFGDFDYDMNKRRHATTHHQSTLNMWKHNKTMKWFNGKSIGEQKRILQSSQTFGKQLRQEHQEAVQREKQKILKLIEDNECKKNEKALTDLAQKNKILDAILEKGFWNTVEELDSRLQTATVEDLKYQVRYRKVFLNEKKLNISGTKTQLCETLRQCIVESSL